MPINSPGNPDETSSGFSLLSYTTVRDWCIDYSEKYNYVLPRYSEDYQLLQHCIDVYILCESELGFRSRLPIRNGEVILSCLRADLFRLTASAAMACWLTTDTFRWHDRLPIMIDTKTPPDDISALSINVNAVGTDFSYGILADLTLDSALRTPVRYAANVLSQDETRAEYLALPECKSYIVDIIDKIKPHNINKTLIARYLNTGL